MNRYASYLLGPELWWTLLYVAAALCVARNQPPTEAGNLRLESLLWFFVLGGVVISFVPLVWANSPTMPGNSWWMLLRIVIVSVIGVCVVTTKLCGGINYNDSRNSGVGSGWMMFIGLGWMALVLGLVIAAVTIWMKARARG